MLPALMFLGPVSSSWARVSNGRGPSSRHIAMERTQSHGNSQDVMSTVSPATRSQPLKMRE